MPIDWSKYIPLVLFGLTTWAAGFASHINLRADVDGVKEQMPAPGSLKVIESRLDSLDKDLERMELDQRSNNKEILEKIDTVTKYLIQRNVRNGVTEK